MDDGAHQAPNGLGTLAFGRNLSDVSGLVACRQVPSSPAFREGGGCSRLLWPHLEDEVVRSREFDRFLRSTMLKEPGSLTVPPPSEISKDKVPLFYELSQQERTSHPFQFISS
uniref:Uncharacterized protein n=1 Tax=Steinernema glaseri TaxID=37863 RepID=A0A1I7YF57_9BILA